MLTVSAPFVVTELDLGKMIVSTPFVMIELDLGSSIVSVPCIVTNLDLRMMIVSTPCGVTNLDLGMIVSIVCIDEFRSWIIDCLGTLWGHQFRSCNVDRLHRL